MQTVESDPLDEIGTLVAQTMDILGGGDPYAFVAPAPDLQTAAIPTDPLQQPDEEEDEEDAVGAASKRLQSMQVDSLDLLGGHERAGSGTEEVDLLGNGGLMDAQGMGSVVTHSQLLQGGSKGYGFESGPLDSPAAGAGGSGSHDHFSPSPHPDSGSAAGPSAPGTSSARSSQPQQQQQLPGSFLVSGGEIDAGGPGTIRVGIKESEKVETATSLIKTHYVQYVVRTDSTVPGLLAESLEVKRRFSDFDALHKHLKQEYRGYFVPPLPEKSFIQGKMAQDDFIRLRRADLQAFMKGLTTHPVLRNSEALKIFLLHPGELTRNPAWTYLVNPPASLKAQRAGSTSSYTSLDLDVGASGGGSASGASAGVASLKAGLGSWVNWMKAVAVQFQPPKRELSEDEVMLRQHKELLQDLEKLLELAVESARSLCAHQEALCGDVRELGRTFAMLSRFEEAVQAKVGQYTPQGSSAANRATDLNKMAYGAVKQHGVWKTLSIKTAASLVTLHDYFVLVPEAIAALELRENALSTLHLLQDELFSKQHAAEQASVAANKLRILSNAPAAPNLAEKRSYQLTTAIGQLEEQIRAAQKDYDSIKAHNQAELARLNLERESDFRRMMAHFATTQAELVRASAEMWANLARSYE